MDSSSSLQASPRQRVSRSVAAIAVAAASIFGIGTVTSAAAGPASGVRYQASIAASTRASPISRILHA